MKVLAINGSPRRNGNTAMLIDAVLERLKKEGIETEKVQLGGKNIRGCIACMKCFEKQNNRCTVDNDIDRKSVV
jgi:multimeric flavodoxin WrbA